MATIEIDLSQPFEDLSIEKVRAFVQGVDEGIQSNRLYLAGDHWQDGTAWIGPRPDEAGNTKFQDTMKEISKALVSKNVVKEVVFRHSSAVIGHDPNYVFTLKRPLKKNTNTDPTGDVTPEKPNPTEQEVIDEVEAAIVEWWDKRRMLHLLRSSVERLLNEGKVVLRVFIPRNNLTIAEDGKVKINFASGATEGDALRSALSKLFVDLIDNDSSGVHSDPNTRAELGFYLTKIPTNPEGTEEQDVAEVCYTNDQGETILQVITEGESTKEDVNKTVLKLDGHLTIFEVRESEIITEQIRQNQNLINLALTMMTRNVVYAGFRERVIINANLPDQKKTIEDDEEKFFPNVYSVGVGAVHNLIGHTFTDAAGVKTYTQPSMQIFDPVSPDTFIATADKAYANILEEVSQLHALIAGDAVTSGVSRIQAKDDFRARVSPTKGAVDELVRWILETILAFAASIANKSARYSILRVNTDTKIDIGRPDANEVTVATTLVDKKIWSRQRVQIYTGVDDPAAEDALISQENPQHKIELATKQQVLANEQAFGASIGADSQTGGAAGQGA